MEGSPRPWEAVAASPHDPPFFNAQGTRDARLAYANAEAIHAALQKAGVSSLLIPIRRGEPRVLTSLPGGV